LERLQQRSASLILDGLMDDLRGRYRDEKVRKYLLRVKSHILKNVEHFAGRPQEKGEGMIMMMGGGGRPEDPFWVYEVNLLLDQSIEGTSAEAAPILEEQNPTYVNLFGAMEYNVSPGGMWSTDFRHIRAGSLLAADGGFLIVNALDVLRRPHVWDQLKRVLKTEQLVIQQPETYSQLAPLTLKPEPIDISVKVIMVGPSWLYHLLWEYEEDFPKVFKILADFDTTMPLSMTNAKEFAAVLKAVGERGKLKPLEASGLAMMLEHGVRESGQRDRLSTRLSYITDVLREADHLANQDEARSITKKHVDAALEAKRGRHGLIESRVQRMIDEGVLLVDTRGKRVGQVNGLAVYSLGSTAFGKPSRVTAVTSVGRSGLVNIEREAGLSGPIHDKGVLILTGYLRHQYAQKAPLTLSASIAFEQSYSGVEGDSASSTEIYALLSSLSGAPIQQGIAVTGSVNQLGDIQPIGGANEKIEGFFDVCKANGLTGKQGVIIPVQNERHVMLREDVVEAVTKGKFHIYSVKSIDEGIEVLTGKKAKVIHDLVHKRLKAIANAVKEPGEAVGATTTVVSGPHPPPAPPKPPSRTR
ncbi:MAG: AAA family ATPase, partial [Deltaproteobacteria bacterium]|nr:AAA family ATPase [Deltaproteobacteria bacterium]